MPLDPQLQQAIAAHMQYMRDLGIVEFYRRGNPSVIEPTPRSPSFPYVSLVPSQPPGRLVYFSAKPRRSAARDPV